MIPPRKNPGTVSSRPAGPPPRKPRSQLETVKKIVEDAKKEADDGQGLLLNVDEDWRKEWQGMPEFSKSKQEPYRTILVHMASKEDVSKFAILLGCKITGETKYVWWPEIKLKRVAKLVVDG